MQLINHLICKIMALEMARCIAAIHHGFNALHQPVIHFPCHEMNIMIGIGMALLFVDFRKKLTACVQHFCDIPSFHVVSILSDGRAVSDVAKADNWTIQMLRCVSRWLNRAPWILVGDGAYAYMALAKTCVKSDATLISRLRLDAQLYEFPNVKPVGKRGRNQVKGLRIQLKGLLSDPSQTWQTLTVKWYGGEQRTIECLTFECLWYHASELPLKLRIVLVKTPGGKNEAETFFSTDITNSPMQTIEWFVLRWNIEVRFAETRAHLGIETQRQWSDKAIARTTPMLMVLLSILVLVAVKMDETKKLLVQEPTSWYEKKGELTLADIIMIIRKSIWVKMYFSTSKNHENNIDSLKITEKNANLLIYQLALAA